ncbi:MAG: hypothetical protein QXP01_09110 [Candidatus Hadarchaeum sp.]
MPILEKKLPILANIELSSSTVSTVVSPPAMAATPPAAFPGATPETEAASAARLEAAAVLCVATAPNPAAAEAL